LGEGKYVKGRHLENQQLFKLLAKSTSCHLLSFLFAWCLRTKNPVFGLKKCYEAFQFVKVN